MYTVCICTRDDDNISSVDIFVRTEQAQKCFKIETITNYRSNNIIHISMNEIIF